MRELQDARTRWAHHLATYPNRASLSASAAQSGAGLRSICWKTWLLFPDYEPETYLRVLEQERGAYEEMRARYLEPVQREEGDPLAEDEANPWTRYRKDEELRKEIIQDVERCMPDVPYFRDPDVQKTLVEVLFVYCRLDEGLGYRQGMHEIVAVILWVVSGDAVAWSDEEQQQQYGDGDGDGDGLLRELLDARFVDHDTFALFQAVMRSAKPWYELGEEGAGKGDGRGKPPIVEKSRFIHEQLLMMVDPELGEHLKALDVLPQVFLIRWIRLLFGREFPLEELLEVWDALFEEDPELVLVDYICVAMLLRIRWQLVEADYSTALTLVLRYPSPAAPHLPATFVADAIHLRSNLTLAGGRHIITQYSSREPAAPKPPPPPPPLKAQRARSPLGSPTRFIPGVQLDSVLSGVLDRGEKWGVQRAVGRAVADVKKNVVVFQQQQSAQWAEARQEVAREEELVRKSRALSKRLKADEERRKLLERMVGLSIDALEQEPLETVVRQTAIERLREVRACLKDGTRVVDVGLLEDTTPPPPPPPPPPLQSPGSPTPLPRGKTLLLYRSAPPPLSATGSRPMNTDAPPPGSPPGFVKTSFKNNSDPDFLTHKPRSSLAQSSFAWMLGDDPSVKAKTGFVARKVEGAGGRRDGVGGVGVQEEEGGGFDLGDMGGK